MLHAPCSMLHRTYEFELPPASGHGHVLSIPAAGGVTSMARSPGPCDWGEGGGLAWGPDTHRECTANAPQMPRQRKSPLGPYREAVFGCRFDLTLHTERNRCALDICDVLMLMLLARGSSSHLPTNKSYPSPFLGPASLSCLSGVRKCGPSFVAHHRSSPVSMNPFPIPNPQSPIPTSHIASDPIIAAFDI